MTFVIDLLPPKLPLEFACCSSCANPLAYFNCNSIELQLSTTLLARLLTKKCNSLLALDFLAHQSHALARAHAREHNSVSLFKQL